MRRIGGILGRSPFGPVHEHMLKVQDCVNRLEPIVEAFVEDDSGRVRELAEEVFKLEAQADAIKTQIRSTLSNSLFSAVQHGEVIGLLTSQDDVADDCQNAARLMDVRRTKVTSRIATALRKAGAAAARTAALLTETTAVVQELERNAAPRESLVRILDHTEAVRREREETSELAHKALRQVFRQEGKLGPVSVIMLMQIVRELSRMAHSAENAADAIARMISGR